MNLLDTQHVGIAIARRARRTPELPSKRCQALERCILLVFAGPRRGGQPRPRVAKPREEMLRLWLGGWVGGSRQWLWDMAKSLANPTSRELVVHNCMILRELKTSHWHDSQIHILQETLSSTNILSISLLRGQIQPGFMLSKYSVPGSPQSVTPRFLPCI